MIIDKPEYRKNSRGEIVKRQIVTVKCDLCGKEWDVPYETRKRKVHKDDRCSSCRMMIKHVPYCQRKKPKRVICSCCGKYFLRPYHCVKQKNYCSRECLSKASLDRLSHLAKTFEENPDEVSYLSGLILGDGWMKNIQRHTCKIV